MTSNRKKLIVGNWKMHLTVAESSLHLHALEKSVQTPKDVDVVLAPSALALQAISIQLKHHRSFKLCAQNCYWRDEGAYTGEVSAHMLRGLVQYVIVGHSERRHVFKEHDNDIRHKVQAVLRNQMRPILCVGETAMERHDGATNFVLHDQVTSGLANVTSAEISQMAIAYEPVWAISRGKDFDSHEVATPDDVSKATKHIRKQVEDMFGAEASEEVRILYGGSTNDHNAALYLSLPDVDGLLVGGASLNPDIFASIVAKASGK